MMIVLSAIGGLSASSLRTGRYVERHLAEMENAQQILAGLPGRDQLANGTQSGEMAGYRWRLDAQPFSAAFLRPSRANALDAGNDRPHRPRPERRSVELRYDSARQDCRQMKRASPRVKPPETGGSLVSPSLRRWCLSR